MPAREMLGEGVCLLGRGSACVLACGGREFRSSVLADARGLRGGQVTGCSVDGGRLRW